jgi:hypothetical protein
MLADSNIRSGWKKNADQENYFNWNEMKTVAMSYHQKIFVL